MTSAAPRLHWIMHDDPADAFPPLDNAFLEPDGLLAAGGDLSEARLLSAYRRGIFPWYDDGQPILWWSPDPRCILRPAEFHLGRRFRRSLKQCGFTLSFNQQFSQVVAACSRPRAGQSGTWITADMKSAYSRLHRSGWAHSIEVWRNRKLVGGMYGLSIGKVFFGESMFSHETDASKAAMFALCAELQLRQFELLDCQVESPHLRSLGATLIRRADFALLLQDHCTPNLQLVLEMGEKREITQYLSNL